MGENSEDRPIDATLDKPWPQSLAGGTLSLDFVNTLDWRGREQPVETLLHYVDLVRFSLAAGAVDSRQAHALLAWAIRHPKRASRTLERARDTREAIAVVVKAMANGTSTPLAALLRLEKDAREAWEARVLSPAAGGARWQWAEGDPDPELPRRAFALDAARLLTLERRPPIRECEGAQCGWFFLDESRNRRRRWCSMEACGNRAKARRFYRRKRGAGAVG